jgi:hypothetical protein
LPGSTTPPRSGQPPEWPGAGGAGPSGGEGGGHRPRSHSEDVLLDIGGDVGALVLVTPPALRGREIEVSPIGQDGLRVHAAVLERLAGGRVVFAAVYPELRAGEHRIWDDVPDRDHRVTIVGGEVAWVEWR